MSIDLPEKISFRWAFYRVSFDRDIARKFAPSEYRAVLEASAIDPFIEVTQVDAMMKAQWERDHPNAQ